MILMQIRVRADKIPHLPPNSISLNSLISIILGVLTKNYAIEIEQLFYGMLKIARGYCPERFREIISELSSTPNIF